MKGTGLAICTIHEDVGGVLVTGLIMMVMMALMMVMVTMKTVADDDDDDDGNDDNGDDDGDENDDDSWNGSKDLLLKALCFHRAP